MTENGRDKEAHVMLQITTNPTQSENTQQDARRFTSWATRPFTAYRQIHLNQRRAKQPECENPYIKEKEEGVNARTKMQQTLIFEKKRERRI